MTKELKPSVPFPREKPLYEIGDTVKINVDPEISLSSYPRGNTYNIVCLLQNNDKNAKIIEIGAGKNAYRIEFTMNGFVYKVWAWEHEITKDKFVTDKKGQGRLF